MLRTRWHLAWLAVWFLGTCVYTVFFVAMMTGDRLFHRFVVLETAGLMLSLYTLPVVLTYVAGLAVGWGALRLGRKALSLGHRAVQRLAT